MDEKVPNRRSDVDAKAAFCEKLLCEGFASAKVVRAPSDIAASKDGVRWLFELKYTEKQDVCFGAATLTEWAAAAHDPDHFRFVIAYRQKDVWRFDRYTPEEFMAFSSVPPFKIYFSVPLNDRAGRKRALRSRRIYLTKERLKLLTRHFEELRSLEE
jgi:hypothetical protein